MLPEEAAVWANLLRQEEPQGLLVPNFAGVKLAQDIPAPFVLDSSMNIMNAWAGKTVSGAQSSVLSPELNQGETRRLLQEIGPGATVMVHTRHLLMVHEQCLVGANAACKTGERGCSASVRQLRDRKGYEFPLLSDVTCRSYLYNSQVFSLIDQVGSLMRQGVGELLIDAEMDSAATLRQVLPLYISAKEQTDRADWQREQLSKIYSGRLTRGHWKRGV